MVRFASICYVPVRSYSGSLQYIMFRFGMYFDPPQFIMLFRFGPFSGSFQFMIFRDGLYCGSLQFMIFGFSLYDRSLRFSLFRFGLNSGSPLLMMFRVGLCCGSPEFMRSFSGLVYVSARLYAASTYSRSGSACIFVRLNSWRCSCSVYVLSMRSASCCARSGSFFFLGPWYS